MVSITIVQLPSENILHIFEFLDAKTLLNASQVCKNWSDLIGSSTTIMKKFMLYLNEGEIPVDLKWKHTSVKIAVYYNPFKETMKKVASAFDISRMRNLTAIITQKFDSSIMLGLLSQMPKLENFRLHLITCRNDFDESKMKQLTLPNLNVMEIFWHGRSNYIFKFMKAEQLSELKLIKNYGDYTSDKIIPNFLKGCSKLKKMFLYGAAFQDIIELHQEFDFQLEVFRLANNVLYEVKDQENFNKFLASQSSSLSVLCFYSTAEFRLENIRSIFNLKALTRLVFEQCYINDELFCNNLESNLITTLIELTIVEGNINQQPENFTKRFLEKSPNLKRLQLQCLFEGALKHISIYCPKLETLAVEEVSDSLDTDSNLANLRHLEVYAFSNKWLSLVVSCPSIESLDVKKVSESQILGKELDVVFKEIKLSHLILKSECSHCDIFVNNNYNINNMSFKTLRLNFDSILDLVMFELTLDEMQWSIEDCGFLKYQIMNNYPDSLSELIIKNLQR